MPCRADKPRERTMEIQSPTDPDQIANTEFVDYLDSVTETSTPDVIAWWGVSIWFISNVQNGFDLFVRRSTLACTPLGQKLHGITLLYRAQLFRANERSRAADSPEQIAVTVSRHRPLRLCSCSSMLIVQL